MRAQRPSMTQAIVKLNEGVSGEGNAIVDLSNLAEATDAAVAERVRAMRFELGTVRFDVRSEVSRPWRSCRGTGRRRGEGSAQPECAIAHHPTGQSGTPFDARPTLGGPSGQSYLGCISRPTQLTRVRSRATPRKSQSFCETPASSAVSLSILSSRARTTPPHGKPMRSRSISGRAEPRTLS